MISLESFLTAQQVMTLSRLFRELSAHTLSKQNLREMLTASDK